MHSRFLKGGIVGLAAIAALASASEAARVVVVRPPYRAWYVAPRPVYPYRPVVFYEPPPFVARTVYVSRPGGTWFYCENPAGYYPYVRHCDSDWRAVPAAPAGEH